MKNTSVALISADYPNFISGTGDYSDLLKKHLEILGVRVYLVTSDDQIIDCPVGSLKVRWRYHDIGRIITKLKEWNISIISIQYPNILYGRYSLVPHCYAVVLRILGYKIVTTIHEYSNVTFLRRISQIVFFLFSHIIISTTDIEKRNIEQSFGCLVRNKTTLINIAPNIRTSNIRPNYSSNVIITFGMFYPDRRIEEVIDFMEGLDKRYKGRFIFRFIGGLHGYYQDYFDRCKSAANKKLQTTEWIINKSTAEVSDSMRDAFVGILFYNDGVSVRRGSLLALIGDGTPIISNKIGSSPELIDIENKGLFFANEKEKSVFYYFDKLVNESEFYLDCYNNLKEYSSRFTFDKTAEEYYQVFAGINKR